MSAANVEPRLNLFSAAAATEPAQAGHAGFETDAPLVPPHFPKASAPLLRLVELLRRPDAPSPFAIGLLAPAGGGKTSTLNWLLRALPAPSVHLRASDLVAEPEVALATTLFRALTPAWPRLAHDAAEEGAQFGADAGAMARAAQEKHDLVRRKLETEKQTLNQMVGRRAALSETMLYETFGSRVDTFARRIRASFEPRLRRFGFAGDPVASFKDLTRDLAETGGRTERLLACLRAVYQFPGQIKLLFWALICFGLEWGANWLITNKASWLATLNNSPSPGAPTAEFLQSHLDWLPQAAQAVGLLGLALLAMNLFHAFRFMQPVYKATSLLDDDVADRTPEMDMALALQARSVEQVHSEAASAGQRAAEAERRAGGASRHPPAFLEKDADAQKRDAARGFLHCLSESIVRGVAPQLIVAVDGFESVAQPLALFGRLHDLLALPGFVTAFALDRNCFGETTENATRRLQLPINLDAVPTEAAFAALNTPLSPLEERLIAALAPLAGDTPRVQKRLRNFYRFLRPAPDAAADLAPALVFMLAADLGASQSELRALWGALRNENHDLDVPDAPRLKEFVTTARAICGPIKTATAMRAAQLASVVSLR